jgi:c-di-GMP-binding flagellar brake protein YcgR
MSKDSNIIKIEDKDSIGRHLKYLKKIGLHCVIISNEKDEINGRFTDLGNEMVEITMLTTIKTSFKKNDKTTVKYSLDNIRHEFETSFITSDKDLLYFKSPIAVTRYQIRRFSRKKILKEDIKVGFNLLTDKPEDLEVKDISEGGMGVHINRMPDDVEKNIRLNSIKLMLKESKTLHLGGVLRYIRGADSDDNDYHRLGIEFDPLRENERLTLLDFIEVIDSDEDEDGDE